MYLPCLLNQKNKEYENKYKESENKFNSTLKEINNAFETYTSKTNEANKFLANIEKEKAEVNKIYEDVKINIFAKSYTSYRINSDYYMKGINPSNSEIETYYKDLSDYFKYHNFKRAQDKYNESMQENFGRYIEPISWCENNICPSKNSIRRVLKQEAERKWDKNIEPNLTRKEFFANSYTRSKIAKELNTNTDGISIYLYEDFLKAYDDLRGTEKRKEGGVFYTPQPIVKFIVETVNYILKNKLGISKGFAEKNVKTLDFATGTGSFLAEVFNVILEQEKSPVFKISTIKDKFLKDIYGFETTLTIDKK